MVNFKMYPLTPFFKTIALISILTLGGCGDNASSTKDKAETLTMGTCADCKPFEYHDTTDGQDKIVGLDIDLAHALAEELGLKLKIQDMDFNSLIPSLQAKRTDFVMSLMTPTEERAKSVSFSDSYFVNRIAIITLKNKQIENKNQLVNKKIGAQLGSTNKQLAIGLSKEIEGLTISTLNKLNELVQEVRSARIDGVITEEINAKAYVETNEDLTYEVIKELETHFAIAFQKDSPWVNKFNLALKKLKADGKLGAIVGCWVKEKEEDKNNNN